MNAPPFDASPPPYADVLFARAIERMGNVPVGDDAVAHFARAVVELEVADGILQGPLRPDADVTGYAQSWLNLLLDNHRLPPDLQLQERELGPARALLAGYFLKIGVFQTAVRQLLALVEQQFNDGHFARATVLLQIFDTDPATRRNNERNLFYEEMVAAFLTPRQKRGMSRESWRRIVTALPSDPGNALLVLVDSLARKAGIRLHLLIPPNLGQAPWSRLESQLSVLGLSDFVSRVAVPVWRLPEAAWTHERVIQAIETHLNHFSVEQYVLRITRAAYFLVLATGRTGYESLILDYHHWMARCFEAIPTRILPEIHRRSTQNDVLLSEALRDAIDPALDHPTEALVMPSADRIEPALQRVVDELTMLEPWQLPEGDYDLGGIVMDYMLGFDQAPLRQRIRQHRLV